MKSVILTLYGVQAYSILVTIAATPFLIQYLGAEGYGLIGLYFVIQMLLQVVDGGLTGTITKLSANLNPLSASSVIHFYASYSYFKKLICAGIFAILCVSLILYLGGFFARLIESSFSVNTINNCVILMVLCVAVRFFSLSDRGFLQGIEQQYAIAVTNFVSVTLRYPIALLILAISRTDITFFFVFQLVVVLVEVCILRCFSRLYMKRMNIPINQKLTTQKETIAKKWLISHSSSLWAISILWVLASQLDKLILSFSVSLEDYGVFSLALVCANLMLTMFIPINQVLMPRFVKLYAKSDKSAMISEVLKVIHLYVCVFSVIGVGFLFFGGEILFLWTSNTDMSFKADEFLGYLAVGNFIHGITNIIFITAYASDNLSMYAKRYMFHVLAFLPISIYAAVVHKEFGVVAVWVASAAIFLGHTAVPFLNQIVGMKNVLYSIVVAFSQLFLVVFFMYLFKSYISLSQFNRLEVLVILALLFSCLLGVNYLLTSKISKFYGRL